MTSSVAVRESTRRTIAVLLATADMYPFVLVGHALSALAVLVRWTHLSSRRP